MVQPLLTEFDATLNGNLVVMNWKMRPDVEGCCFNVQRSNDGDAWHIIGAVTEKSGNLGDYSFVNMPVSGAHNYYRLQLIEKNGRVSYSKIRIVDTLQLMQTHGRGNTQRLPGLLEQQLTFFSNYVKGYAVLILNVAGEIEQCNREAIKLVGHVEQEIVGRPLSIFYSADGSDGDFPSVIMERARRQGYYECEELLLKKDGSMFWAVCSFAPLYLEGGLTGYVVAIKDISGEKILEDMRLQRLLIDNIPDCIYVKDLNLRYMVNNPANIKLMGASSEEETRGKTMFDYFDVELAMENMKLDMSVLKNKKPVYNYGNTVLDKTGDQRAMLTSKIPLIDGSGGVVGILGITRDVTDQRRAEQEVASSAVKYKTLFDHNPLPMVIAGVPELDILEANDAMTSTFGFSKEEILGMNGLDFLTDEERSHFLAVQCGRSEEMKCGGVWRHVKKGGAIIHLEVFWQDIVHEGRPARLVIGNDVTERVNAENDIQASNEQLRQLASRLQDIREEERIKVAGEIHDELGQRLTGLKMDCAWVAGKLGFQGGHPIQEKIDEMTVQLDEAVRAVQRVMTELRPSILDHIGLADALEWYSREFERRFGIQVDFCSTLDEAIAPKVSTGLFRIYQETLNNVSRHAEATVVTASLHKDGDRLLMIISDNGKGFTKVLGKGHATLGVLGMRERASIMGGGYEFEGAPGQGTTTTVSIPWMES